MESGIYHGAVVRKGNEYGSSGQVIKRDEAERYGR